MLKHANTSVAGQQPRPVRLLIKGPIWIQNLAICWIAIWSISPPLFSNPAARLLVVISTALWFAMEMLRKDGLAKKFRLPVLLSLIYIAYTGMIEFFISGPQGLIGHLQLWIMLFFLIVWQSRRDNLESLTPVFWTVAAVFPIWLFITNRTIATVDDHAARIIVRSSDEAASLTQQGVGGYALVYGALLLLPALIWLISNPKSLRLNALSGPLRKAPKLALTLLLLNLALSVYLVLTAGYSIAVIAFLGIVAAMLFLKRLTIFSLIASVFALLFFSLAADTVIKIVLESLLPIADGTNFARKIEDVLISIEVGEASGSAAERTERYTRSLALFLENPLVGVWSFDNVGKHSQILDSLARWGIIFGGILVYLLFLPAARLMRNNSRDFGGGLAMLIALFVIFGFNNGFAAAGLMLYIMFPVSYRILANYRKEQTIQRGGPIHG